MNRNDPGSKDKFLRLQDAYTVLSNRESRRKYDQQFQQTRRTTASNSRFTGPFTPPKQSHYGFVIACFYVMVVFYWVLA